MYIHQKNQLTLKSQKLKADDAQVGKEFKSILEMGNNLTLKLSSLQRLIKFELENCWEIEKVKKNISLISDSKSYVDLFRIVNLILSNSLYSNNLSNIEYTKEITDNISNLLTIKHVCDKVISNVNITFKDNLQFLNNQKSFEIYEQDPIYMTSRNKATSTEIIYESKNESIVRRIVLHTLHKKLNLFFSDPIANIEKSKKRAFSDAGGQTNTRKVNYYYEAQPSSKAKNRTSKINSKLDETLKKEE